MSATKKLVKTLFVKVENQGDDSWYATASTIGQIVSEETALIGEYSLVKTFNAKLVPQVVPAKPKPRKAK